ncbi:hypothetical protein C8Q72DRAFT_830347, partial [Fomitopsis betulina]
MLIDPDTLEITGIIDWDAAAVMPAYHEYARKELLEVFRNVLRAECEVVGGDGGQRYEGELAAWNELVDVERAAQGYSDSCWSTFESDPEGTASTTR